VEVDKGSSIEWFAVQVQPKHESITAAHLQYKGYESYVPLYVPRREPKHGRAGNRLRPVFPGYVFCRFCLEDGAAIRSGGGVVTTAGVVRIIGVGRTPVPIPNEEIEAIQRILGSGLPADPVPYLRVGQKVQINAGPLRGIVGIIQSAADHHLIVSIELLQRSLTVVIDREWINPIPLISEAMALSRSNKW